MNNYRFTELLNRYLNDKATRQEREELMNLIAEGTHDDALRDSIKAMFMTGSIEEDMDPRNARKILKGILETSNEQERIVPFRAGAGRWTWLVAAAVLLIAVTAGAWIFKMKISPQESFAWKETLREGAVFTGKQFVRLPDGSTVLLNEGSELSYPTSFGEQVRKVTLTGEAYFDVRHDPSKPFKVLTGKVTTTVLGTAFNVKAYPGQPEIQVTVMRGKVRVGNEERTFGIIQPDQQIAVNTATNQFVQKNLKAETAEVWKSQHLILDDVSIEEALRTIGERYRVQITIGDAGLKKCRITATFLHGESFDQVLTVVCGVVGATYAILPDGKVKIEGKGCQ